MVWKRTTTVAFGIKGRWVYARYCSVAGNTGLPASYIENVKQDCVKDAVDVCFQAAALKAHNEKRARHRNGRPLAADPAASNHIQKVLSGGNFKGTFNLPVQFADCGVNVYKVAGTAAAVNAMERETKAQKATDAWYSGQSLYDYASGRPFDQSAAAKTAEYAKFANVVWASTTRAGFGHRGEWVVALYCQTKATPFDRGANEDNIGKQCSTQGVNQCLNDELRKLHNAKRLRHASPPLEFDGDLAKKLQAAMDAASATFTKTTKLTLGADGGGSTYED